MHFYVLVFILLFSYPFVSLESKRHTSCQKKDNSWYCMYCGFANEDKYSKCRNWECPTNKSGE